MAIETQLNYITGKNQIGFPVTDGSFDFSLMNGLNNGGFDQFHIRQKSQQPRQPLDQPILFNEQCSVLMERQKQDIDQFINLQHEKMRFVLQEQRKHQMEEILTTIKARARVVIRQKDHEIAKASRRIVELETLLQRMEMEKMTWQQAAKDNESMAEYLNNMLEKAMENNNNACCLGEEIEDAASCCGGADDKEKIANDMVCRSCGSRAACVLFLPCRHLSSCRDCEVGLGSCPRCNAPKKFTIEVLIFQEGR